MIKKDNVFARADEKFVKTLLVYANESNVLFYDAESVNAVLTTEVQDLFLKDITVVDGENYLKPVAFTEAGVVCYDGSAAVTFTATKPVEE